MAENKNVEDKTRSATSDDKEKRSSSRGKQPAKKSTPTESVNQDLNNNLVLECLKSIQQTQTDLVSRMEAIEKANADYEYDYAEYEDDTCSSPKRPRLDYHTECETNTASCSTSENNSRFLNLKKKLKPDEVCDKNVDNVLASTVNELFRKGMDTELYDSSVKDENCARPENCDALVAARTNKLIWDNLSPYTRTNDKKLQAINNTVVKAGVCLTKTMENIAQLEKSMLESDKNSDSLTNGLSYIMNGCNDALALMGHANFQTNMCRRDLMKPDLSRGNREYGHLCNHSLPVTQELFGDDVSKTAREIEDLAKISNKMMGQPYRGTFRGRPAFRGRMRGFGPPRGSGRGYASPSPRFHDQKNPQRRGVKYRV